MECLATFFSALGAPQKLRLEGAKLHETTAAFVLSFLSTPGSQLSVRLSTTYQVIARKWRPQTFDDVVGQDHVVRTLKNAISRQRIAHAYLFVGPRGTGKTSTARIFAKALNCTDGPKADFDPNDPACKAIAEGSHLDVIEIDGADRKSVV